MKFKEPQIKNLSESELWQRRASCNEEKLTPLDKPCRDCAVVHGLYTGLSESLARQPIEIRNTVARSWFCHAHPDRACRGNWDIVFKSI